MRVLFDVDVILDLLLDREPHSVRAARLLSRAESGEIGGLACATAITTIHYLAARSLGARKARQHIKGLLSIIDIAPVGRSVLSSAFEMDFADFEDAVTHEAARIAGADAIVTRNTRDYKKALIPVYSPPDLISLLQSQGM